ncbi:MFS general substrate transporter [Diplogelasinospora grovesii]|uniref:MFS general substrate transporter n=1 Tax=Diplogelasinospora grovesii TaxID=303347 RepID=A0AAN6MX44_9PEZI|nr:MFS general substrate transporter [Diplogelasinospora grovesii]
MKTARYSASRQKACQSCSNAKAKCDRKAGSCSRSGNFSGRGLLCPINVDSISIRWMNPYIPVPGQTIKAYPPTIIAFIYRVLKSYASIAVRGRGIPPFVHSSQVTATSSSPPIATCLSLVRICDTSLPGSDDVAADVLMREMNNLYERREAYDDDMASLAAFQAYLIYSMVLFFRLQRGADPFLRQAVMALQEIACSSSRRGLLCPAEQQRARPRWEAWIVAEAKRRTLFTMYLFDSVLSARDGLPTFLGTELRGLLAPSDKALWQAGARYDWETSYNVHLVDWVEGALRIDELWPIPADLDEASVVKRRGRVDQWLENVDEFGTMIYAVTSCTHANMTLPIPPPAEEPYSIFDKRQRALIVLIVSVTATFSGFASNIYFPALPTVADDMGVSIELVNLTVTSYLIFQGVAPSLWGPISDVKGRRAAYCCTFLVFLGACVGLAESRNYTSLLVLRCLQSTGSASTIAIGSGVIGDISTRADRGGLMGVFQAGLLVPVAVGPVIGGGLAGSLGWRSIFWFLTIYTSVFLALLVFLLPETLRSIVGNGSRTSSLNAITRYPLNLYQRTTEIKFLRESSPPVAAAERKHTVDVTGPFRILVSRQAAPIIFFVAVYYAVWQMSITAMSSLFAEKYGLGETQIGLTFIANGVGSMVGTLITGKILDVDYRRVKAPHQGAPPSEAAETGPEDDEFPLEKARLRLIPIFSVLQCMSVMLFGWTIRYEVHIAVPIVSTFITGWTAVATQSVVMTYLVDVFHDRSAAASASLNPARCFFAAGGTSFVMPLINAIGVGLAFTVCVAAQCVAMLCLAVQWRFGTAWRREARQKAQEKQDGPAGN